MLGQINLNIPSKLFRLHLTPAAVQADNTVQKWYLVTAVFACWRFNNRPSGLRDTASADPTQQQRAVAHAGPPASQTPALHEQSQQAAGVPERSAPGQLPALESTQRGNPGQSQQRADPPSGWSRHRGQCGPNQQRTPRSPHLTAQTCASTLWALAKARTPVSPTSAWLAAAAEAMVSRADDFQPRELANSFMALARLGFEFSSQQLDHLAAGVLPRLRPPAGDFAALDVQMLLEGFARRRHHPGDELLGAAIAAAEDTRLPADPASVLTSLAHLQYRPPPGDAALQSLVLAALRSPALRKWPGRTLRALLMLGVNPGPEWLAEVTATATPGALGAGRVPRGSDLIELLSALAGLGHQPEAGWIAAVLAAVQADAESKPLRQRHVAELWTALAVLDHRPGAAFAAAFTDAAAGRVVPLAHFTGAPLASLLWALARLKLPLDAGWLREAANRAREVYSVLRAHEAVYLLWSLAELAGADVEAVAAASLANRALDHSGELQPRDVAVLAWSMATAGLRQPGTGGLPKGLAAEVRRRLRDFSLPELVDVWWAFSQLERHPGPAVRDRLLALLGDPAAVPGMEPLQRQQLAEAAAVPGFEIDGAAAAAGAGGGDR